MINLCTTSHFPLITLRFCHSGFGESIFSLECQPSSTRGCVLVDEDSVPSSCPTPRPGLRTDVETMSGRGIEPVRCSREVSIKMKTLSSRGLKRWRVNIFPFVIFTDSNLIIFVVRSYPVSLYFLPREVYVGTWPGPLVPRTLSVLRLKNYINFHPHSKICDKNEPFDRGREVLWRNRRHGPRRSRGPGRSTVTSLSLRLWVLVPILQGTTNEAPREVTS